MRIQELMENRPTLGLNRPSARVSTPPPGREPRTMPQEPPIDVTQLRVLAKALNKAFHQIGIDIVFTQHFLQRVNNIRGRGAPTLADLRQIFNKTYEKQRNALLANADKQQKFLGFLHDTQTKLNVPFVLEYDPRNNEFDLVAKTAMKTGDWKPGRGEKKLSV